MKNRLRSSSRNIGSGRRGAAMLIVIVAVAVCAGVCQSLLMALVRQHRRLDHELRQSQVEWLAESALLRGVELKRRNPSWDGETWSPSLSGLTTRAVIELPPASPTAPPGVVTIRVTAEILDNAGGKRTVVRTYTGSTLSPDLTREST